MDLKILPQSIEIESAVLGALMLEPAGLDDVFHKLKAKMFYKDINKTIYEAIILLYNENSEIDILTVSEKLKKMDKLEKIGGYSYIAELTSKVASAAHLEYHSMIIIQKYMAREMIRISDEITTNSFNDEDIADVIEKAEKDIFALTQGNIKNEPQLISVILDDRLQEIVKFSKLKGDVIGVPANLASLDKVTGGWQKTDLIIIAARPSVGKTAFAIKCAKESGKNGDAIGLFSLEMSAGQLIDRLISSETECTPTEIRNARNITVDEIAIASNKLPTNIIIDDTPSLSVYEFRSKARRLKSKNDIKLLIVDYLQLMRGSDENRGKRESEVSEISRILKATAKELDIPIIALSQLNRSVESRSEKRPQLSDLRESGAIEQDADIVIFLNRPERYGQDTDEEGHSLKGIVELIIAKNRNGAIADIPLKTNEACTKWYSVVNDYFETQSADQFIEPNLTF